MKVKCLVRNPDVHLRDTKRDLFRVARNYDPALHPFEAQREYVRALNAVKLDRLFAKPFLGNLDGHRDGVSVLSKHPSNLSLLVSGSFDGEVKLWNLPTKTNFRSIQAHDGSVKGIAFTAEGTNFISIGDDKTIKMWNTQGPQQGEDDLPVNTIISKDVLLGISHSHHKEVFATCGETCQLWEQTRNEPLKSLKWGADTLHHIAYNPSEHNLLSACGSDNSIVLHDTRNKGPVRKVVLTLKTNSLCWNPMEPFHFVAANEDYNLYTFDMRNLRKSLYVHVSHVAPVICVDYSPTGLEFVSGSYDKSIRIFNSQSKMSREVYFTKRMQRLTDVAWSLDDKYVLSASDEMNIRIWKARASEKIGVLRPREREARNYNESLINKFSEFPQIKKINKFRRVPKHIFNARREHALIRNKQRRKERNRRKHSKPGAVPFVSENRRNIVQEIK